MLNGFSLKGLVSGDVEDLVILFEPGEPVAPNIPRTGRAGKAAFEKYQRLSTEPLAGVTAALEEFPPEETPATARPRPLPMIAVPPPKPDPVSADDGGPTKTVTGTIVDHEGRPVATGQVWLPVQWVSPSRTLTAKADWDGQAPFQLTFPEAWLPANTMQRLAIVWAYAPGHAIGFVDAQEQLFDAEDGEAIRIELPAAEDLSFVVQLPDGAPAAGARVAPLHFQTGAGNYYLPRELADLVAGVTDAAGWVALPALTRDGVYNIDVELPGYGTQQFRCAMKSTDPPEQTLRLRAVGRVEGRIAVEQLELTRDMFVSIETTDRQLDGVRRATGVALVEVDEHGRFVIPEIASGQLEVWTACDERLPVRARLPEHGELELYAQETASVEIPLEMAVPVRGVVRAKDTQQPLAGVTLTVRYGSDLQGQQTVTDAQGEYTALVLPGTVFVNLYELPKGYEDLGQSWNDRPIVPADAKEFVMPPIEVVPAHDLVGTLVDHEGNPLANVRISGVFDNRRYGFGQTDDRGAFVLHDVPRNSGSKSSRSTPATNASRALSNRETPWWCA